ncbi:MAG: hypothetical protein LBP79_06450 [Clostridiales bacterium]|jgi:D-alanine-D-alanine ligase|nr:hypothetical protein [Clostridiales bacterium]
MKKNILVIFGGKSCEHDISVITAVQAMRSMNGEKYGVFPFYIDGVNGKSYTGAALKKIGTYRNFNSKRSALKTAELTRGGIILIRIGFLKKRVKIKIDAALICCHGGIGENGGVQGLLEFYDIPYTSPGIAASAVFMDKTLTKSFLIGGELPALPYFAIADTEIDAIRLGGADAVINTDTDKSEDTDKKTSAEAGEGADLKYPLIAKPASLGSSIGISVARTLDELKTACVTAAEFDSKIIVEKALEDFCEINCAAVRDGENIIVSECEKPVSWSEYLTFDEKYRPCPNSGGAKNRGGTKNPKREYPAVIPANLRDAVRGLTRLIYSRSDMKGSVRIDFLIDKRDGRVYVNEVNTVPGSLAHYLFAENGITLSDLIDIMINTCLKEKMKTDAKKYIYKSDVLDCFSAADF